VWWLEEGVEITAIVPVGKKQVWDITVEKYGNYLCAGVINSNSGKTVFGSRLSVWAMNNIPECEAYAFHVSEKRSIDDQQRFIHEALPEHIRNLPTKKGIHHSVQYTQKNGFTDGICIVPPFQGYRRGGSIKFYNYAQYQQNDQIIEGIKAHLIWLDEKVPLSLLNTLKYRLFTYHGRILLTYTVIDGWNDTIEKILAKTKTLVKKRSERLGRDLPVMQQSLSMDSCAIYYAWTEDNPFTDVKEFWKLNATEDKATILARAYGVPTKSISGAFPLFSRDVHVIAHEKLPWLNLKKNAKGDEILYKTTRYMSIDLGGSKNWCMLWVAIDARNTWWVYREWPDISYGDWALPGDKEGPAQKGLGYDIAGYIELIRGYEEGETIFERFIDPRMGAAERQSKDRGAVTVISDLEDGGMPVIPAPAASSDSDKGEIEDGIQLISNLLHYDAAKPIDSLNSPRIFISDRCQNFIYCMSEYTGRLGPKEHTKDFVDLLRYLRKGNCEYVDASAVAPSKTGVY
jgi:hypothetical protein